MPPNKLQKKYTFIRYQKKETNVQEQLEHFFSYSVLLAWRLCAVWFSNLLYWCHLKKGGGLFCSPSRSTPRTAPPQKTFTPLLKSCCLSHVLLFLLAFFVIPVRSGLRIERWRIARETKSSLSLLWALAGCACVCVCVTWVFFFFLASFLSIVCERSVCTL